jgi:hypothetical protein
MCGLCGTLGGAEDWSSTAVGGEGVTRRAARQRRVRLANQVLTHFGLSLHDWQGSAFLLTGRTGKTEMADNLLSVWQAGAKICGRPLDPLDPGLIERLEALPPSPAMEE